MVRLPVTIQIRPIINYPLGNCKCNISKKKRGKREKGREGDKSKIMRGVRGEDERKEKIIITYAILNESA